MAVFSSSNHTRQDQELLKAQTDAAIIFPWSQFYKSWWGFTVLASFFTIFEETYVIAFGTAGMKPYTDAASIIEYVVISIFCLDIAVNFNLAFYDEHDRVVVDRNKIAKHYLQFWFWIDFIGVFPFYAVALAMAGEMGVNSHLTQMLSLLRLAKLVRGHRVKLLFDILQYSSKISLVGLTMTRNFCAIFVWTHCNACVLYFIARQYDFDDGNTWLGGLVHELNPFDRYITSLYWSVVTVSALMLSTCG